MSEVSKREGGEAVLGHIEFVEVIIRLGYHKYKDGTIADRFSRCLQEDIVPNACKADIDVFREKLKSDKMQAIYKKHSTKLRKIYNIYAGNIHNSSFK